PRPHHLLTIRPPGPRRHLRPARRARCDERWAELAPGRPSLDAQHLDQAIPAGMTPPEMARHVGVPLPDFLGRQPRQQIHLLLDGTAAEERAHALGAGRRFARGELVEEAQEGPAVGAATDVFLGFPTLVRRRCRVPGPTPWGAEQDRHALPVIHGHISMTTGGPRLWRGATCGASFLVPEGDTQLSADGLHEGALERVLEVVVQLGIALAGEREPLPPERLEHLAEQWVGRRGSRGAVDREDRFWRPVQHVGPAGGCPRGERSVKASGTP